MILLRLLRALFRCDALWVGKLIIDEVVARAKFPSTQLDYGS